MDGRISSFELTIKHGSVKRRLTFPHPDPSVHAIVTRISAETLLAPESIRLLHPKLPKSLSLCDPVSPTSTPISSTGLTSGATVMVLGSSAADIAHVRSAAPQPRMLTMEEEDLRESRRRASAASCSSRPPSHTQFTFGSYRVLRDRALSPPPAAAEQLLFRLANDAAILSIMAQHKWAVPLLAEMPPEGLVGVSEVCVLGYNVNRGQEIHLRVRTDDLRGFRKYRVIRDTLLHELVHNEIGPHNTAFKELNSALQQHAAEVDASLARAQTAAGGPVHPGFDGDDGLWGGPAGFNGGSRVQRLGGGAIAGARPSAAAAAAALQRAEAHQASQPASDGAAGTSAPAAAADRLEADDPAHHGRHPDACTAEADLTPPLDWSALEALMAALSSGTDDGPVQQRCAQAAAGVQRLAAQATREEASQALASLQRILQNCRAHPDVERYRRIRAENAAFASRVARFPGAVEVIRAAGYVLEGDSGGATWCLRRVDPALLWAAVQVVDTGITCVNGSI